MKTIHLTPASYVHQPWKNGGGTTTEVARQGDDGSWLWRFSVADVDRSGPFSDFTGYRRIIALIEGRGMALSFDKAAPVVLDRPYRPFAFDGGWRATCRLLDGPVRDMNLIANHSRVAASLDIRTLHEATAFQSAVDDCALLHAITGSCAASIAGRNVTLQSGDTLRVDDAAGARALVRATDPRCVLAVVGIAYRR